MHSLTKRKKFTEDLPQRYKAQVAIEPCCETETISEVIGVIESPTGEPCGRLEGFLLQNSTLLDCEAASQETAEFGEFLSRRRKIIPGLSLVLENLLEGNDIGYLTNLHVLEAHQGRQVGITLLKRITRYLHNEFDVGAVFWKAIPLTQTGEYRKYAHREILALKQAYRRHFPSMIQIPVPGDFPYQVVPNPLHSNKPQ